MSRLYHGGAPGFIKGEIIGPHPTKHFEGCPTCAARLDENHSPDHVFATPERLYAKYYASKWGRGTLYQVEPVGEPLLSDHDSIVSLMAPSLRVVKVLERGVRFTQSERRAMYRLWAAADAASGRLPMTPSERRQDAELRRLIGLGPREMVA